LAPIRPVFIIIFQTDNYAVKAGKPILSCDNPDKDLSIFLQASGGIPAVYSSNSAGQAAK